MFSLMADINWLSVCIAVITTFVLAGIWYSDSLFGQTWRREANVAKRSTNTTLIFSCTFLLTLISVVAFAIVLGPHTNIFTGLVFGVGIGFCWIAPSFGINYLFAGRSLKFFLIDSGFYILQFILYGIIFGLWH